MKTRYAFGGDEHIFVEVAEAMSLEAFFKGLALTQAIKARNLAGITEICPANASFQIKYDPDIIHPTELITTLKTLESEAQTGTNTVATRVIEIPVFYGDPETQATGLRFRDRHQDPSASDLEYAAKINGYSSVDDFIAAHHQSPWFVTMVGFVAGLPFMYQMVDRAQQIQVPKYLSPRTDTPKHTIGHGGCFSCIYSVRGAGGYQMFGITPMPIYDPSQTISYLQDFMVFFKPGDIVKYQSIDQQQYQEIEQAVAQGQYQPNIKPFTFSLSDYQQNIPLYNQSIVELINGD